MTPPEDKFSWTAYYQEFADKLLIYKNNRPQLLDLLKATYDELGMKYPFVERDGTYFDDVCPFTVFACFNKWISNEKRIDIMASLGRKLGVTATVPQNLDGIPILVAMNAWFFAGKDRRREEDIPNLWDLYEAAIAYADAPADTTRDRFISCYEKVRKQYGIKWNLTMGLYWIRPYAYLNLDERNRTYLLTYEAAAPFRARLAPISELKSVPDAETYLALIGACQAVFHEEDSPHRSFPELSSAAWIATTAAPPTKPPGPEEGHRTPAVEPVASADPMPVKREAVATRRYWIYAPGRSSSKWEEFYAQGIMGIEWDKMGDLRQYPSRAAMVEKMKEVYGPEYTYVHWSLTTWQFTHEMQPGDVVYAKHGVSKIIGRGIVESDYIFDDWRNEYKSVRKVRWTHKGEWPYPGQAPQKTLTDITAYIETVQNLESLFNVDEDEVIVEPVRPAPPYTEQDFLREVFMDAERYHTLVNLLRSKKNLILQGAPGVGKTFVAKRLAYAMMGEKDTSRVMMVQFHQSYSYEDFIMGFRPTKDGFALRHGPFYEFCKRAEEDEDREYFFIIDEINRGNVSKIFGELMMLIEKDKRGEQIRLLYSKELFAVPSNLYIIGMMNTADRSLAFIDYALRRRFAFFELEPAFDSAGFKAFLQRANHPKLNALIEQVKELNDFISRDESLGSGFRIGHSYFCSSEEITDQWLEGVIKYELLPLLQEYWFDEPAKIEQWAKRLCDCLND